MSALSLQPTPPFVLERFFAAHEFSCKHALCSSDTEAVSLADTVARMSGDTRALWESLSLGYTETRGHPRMLELLAEDYDGLAPANFQELAPQEAILLTFAALLEPGDAVVATAPGYQSFFTCAEAAGGVVAEWRPRFDGGAARFDVADLERLCAAHRPKCIAVNFPHNPTGALPSEEEWARVVDVCDAHGAYLFADEIYRGLGRTLPAAAAAYGRGISLGGLSKSLGMPGVRAGWLAAEDDAFLTRVAELRARPPAPSEILRRATQIPRRRTTRRSARRRRRRF
ncbi:aminotransferase [Aureococcus anophagefferens]|uniref:Aminotransferase n=1 Tax=Aureococcus anophagefferens TaxID=44056 RepID=A0ABR1FVL2_AURAN